MTVSILEAMERDGFEEVVALSDPPSGARGFLAIHDSSPGRAFGGVRRFAYRDEKQALLDCLRLSRAMTHKCLLFDLPAGGAKLVLWDRPGVDREAAYRHVGRVVERMGGRFYTGPDVGTGPRELGWMASETGWVTRPDESGPGDLGRCTARGVHAAMAAALRHLDGAEDWPARTVAVQGLGSVGEDLARLLRGGDARVVAADVDAERAGRLAEEIGLELVDPARILDARCDVFAPCALGGTLHDLSIERIGARAVVGGANNQLARSHHADRLHGRGVLYVPDFVASSGALLRGAHFHLDDRRLAEEDIGERVARVTAELLELARQRDLPPARVAVQEAERRLLERREARAPDSRSRGRGVAHP